MNNWRDIDTSTPDGLRALDVEIAKRRGWVVEHGEDVTWLCFEDTVKVTLDKKRRQTDVWAIAHKSGLLSRYTTDLNAAAVLLKGFPVIQIEELPDADTDDSLGWSVYIQRNGVSGQANGGESLPLAICKAWLNWQDKQVSSSNPDIP